MQFTEWPFWRTDLFCQTGCLDKNACKCDLTIRCKQSNGSLYYSISFFCYGGSLCYNRLFECHNNTLHNFFCRLSFSSFFRFSNNMAASSSTSKSKRKHSATDPFIFFSEDGEDSFHKMSEKDKKYLKNAYSPTTEYTQQQWIM